MKSGMKIMFDFSFQWKFQRESHAIEISNMEESQMVVSLFLFELGVKNSFDAYVFSLVFAIIVAAFNIIYAGGVSNSSGFASPIAPAADHQL
ncbi:hypothetical protein WN943_023434 [Citrus x changshan-huyou]